jgi:thiol-disulfide isomerase/thioredoxin
MRAFLKKNLSTIIWAAIIAVLIFSPDAKALFLKGFLKIGLFKASTEKESLGNGTAMEFIAKDGKKLNTAELQGKVVFLNFWATWCPPCMAEMSSIDALYNKLKNNPHIVFIMVDADSDFTKAEAFMNKHQYSLPVYSQASNLPADVFSGSLPTTIVIDAKGQIVKKHVGIANYDTGEMLEFLQSL